MSHSPPDNATSRKIVAPLYDAAERILGRRNRGAPCFLRLDYYALLYHTNDDYLTREPSWPGVRRDGSMIPDLKVDIKELMVVGDQCSSAAGRRHAGRRASWSKRRPGRAFKTWPSTSSRCATARLAKAYPHRNWEITALHKCASRACERAR